MEAAALLMDQATRGGVRAAMNIFTSALLYSLAPDGGPGACSAAAVRTQRAVLTGLLFLCSTEQGQAMLECASSLFLLEETVFGLVFANDIDVRLHAVKVLLKAAQQPRLACLMCERNPLHGLFACLGSNCEVQSRRVLCVMLQLMAHLLGCDAAAAHPDDFVEHLPFLLERIDAAFPDPHDPVRALAEPVHRRLSHLFEASGSGRGWRAESSRALGDAYDSARGKAVVAYDSARDSVRGAYDSVQRRVSTTQPPFTATPGAWGDDGGAGRNAMRQPQRASEAGGEGRSGRPVGDWRDQATRYNMGTDCAIS